MYANLINIFMFSILFHSPQKILPYLDAMQVIVICKLPPFLGGNPTIPIKILQGKFYATQIFKHSDWLKNLSSQSKCMKNSLAQNLSSKIFIGSGPKDFLSQVRFEIS